MQIHGIEVEPVTTFEAFKAARGGSAALVMIGKAAHEAMQRRAAVDAYLDAFPARDGDYRRNQDNANTYGNYQVCAARGWHSLVPKPVRW